MPATLWSIKYSPWSVRARWGLRVLKFEYETKQYTDAFLGEWRLRLMLRKWKISIPVLVDDKAIMGGPEMLEHAEKRTGAAEPKLLRQGVDDWVRVADDVMNNERARGLEVALSNNEALKGMVPPGMRWMFRLGPLGMFLIRSRVKGLVKKYPMSYDEEELKAALTRIRIGIQASSTGYLVGDSFSFADIACAMALETVRASPDKHVVRFFPPHGSLDYPMDELMIWRDKIYAKHWVEGV